MQFVNYFSRKNDIVPDKAFTLTSFPIIILNLGARVHLKSYEYNVLSKGKRFRRKNFV